MFNISHALALLRIRLISLGHTIKWLVRYLLSCSLICLACVVLSISQVQATDDTANTNGATEADGAAGSESTDGTDDSGVIVWGVTFHSRAQANKAELNSEDGASSGQDLQAGEQKTPPKNFVIWGAKDSAQDDSKPLGPEDGALGSLPLLTEKDILSFSLIPLDMPRQPKKNSQSLNKCEVMFCSLMDKHLIEYDEKLAKICEKADILPNMQDSINFQLEPYMLLLRYLKATRFKNEAAFTDADYESAFNVSTARKEIAAFIEGIEKSEMPKPSTVLSDQQNEQCFILEQTYPKLKAFISFGYPLKEANKFVELYNQRCSGRVSTEAIDLANTDKYSANDTLLNFEVKLIADTIDYVQPAGIVPNEFTPQDILDIKRDNKIVTPPISYLWPCYFQAGHEQQKDEIVEMQKYLALLGYLEPPASGALDKQTLKALKAFSNDLNLIEVEQPSFSTLMYLRVFSVGFSSEQFINPINQWQVEK